MQHTALHTPVHACLINVYIIQALQRTHLYYMTFSGGKHKISGSSDVTLVTIFTIDRYENFLLFIRWWQGPISAVIYCSEDEVKPITRLMQASAVISQKALTVHLVYKRLVRKSILNIIHSIPFKN